MATEFKFVGGTTKSKVEWPIEVQAFAIAAKRINGSSAKEAFAQALGRLNEIRESEGKSPVELAKSYTGKYAGSLMWGVEKRFLANLKKNTNPEYKKWATALGLDALVEEVEVPDETEAQ